MKPPELSGSRALLEIGPPEWMAPTPSEFTMDTLMKEVGDNVGWGAVVARIDQIQIDQQNAEEKMTQIQQVN